MDVVRPDVKQNGARMERHEERVDPIHPVFDARSADPDVGGTERCEIRLRGDPAFHEGTARQDDVEGRKPALRIPLSQRMKLIGHFVGGGTIERHPDAGILDQRIGGEFPHAPGDVEIGDAGAEVQNQDKIEGPFPGGRNE